VHAHNEAVEEEEGALQLQTLRHDHSISLYKGSITAQLEEEGVLELEVLRHDHCRRALEIEVDVHVERAQHRHRPATRATLLPI